MCNNEIFLERLVEMQIFIHMASLLCGSAGLIIALWYVLRSGKIIKGVFIGWGLSIVCVFLVVVVFPAVLTIFNEQYTSFFPDAIGLPLIMLTGWLPALIVAILAGLTRYGFKHFRPDSGHTRTKKGCRRSALGQGTVNQHGVSSPREKPR